MATNGHGSGASTGEIESTKSVSEIYAPLSGTVVEVNAALEDAPELVNQDPYGEGWIFEVEMSDSAVLDSLMDAAGYRTLVEGWRSEAQQPEIVSDAALRELPEGDSDLYCRNYAHHRANRLTTVICREE